MPAWRKSNSSTAAVPAGGNLCGKIVPARYVFAIFGFIAMVAIYGVKLDLSIPMGSTDFVLTANRSKHRSKSIFDTIGEAIPQTNNESCYTYSTRPEAIQNGTFYWSEPLQGTLLSSYLWSFLFSQIPGAYIAENFSAKYVMVFSIALQIIGLTLVPLTYKIHCSFMTVVRILEGIGGGVAFPAMHVLLAAWAPREERSFMSALIYASSSLGIAFSIFQTGYTDLLGVMSLAWMFSWIYFVQDTPNEQRRIDIRERNYINASSGIDDRSDRPAIPWRDIFTSRPFLAILVAHTCSFWGLYTILIGTSFYFEEVLQFNIKDNAVSGIPFLTMCLFSIVLGKTLDTFCARGSVSVTLARKVATFIATVIPAICLLVICFTENDKILSGVIMGIGITSIGGMFCGFLSNHIDLAPNYSGTLMAITNTAATIPGLIIPYLIDAVVYKDQTIGAWRIIFFIAIAIYIVAIIVYALFASGEEQPWSKVHAVELNAFTPSGEMEPMKSRASYDIDH